MLHNPHVQAGLKITPLASGGFLWKIWLPIYIYFFFQSLQYVLLCYYEVRILFLKYLNTFEVHLGFFYVLFFGFFLREISPELTLLPILLFSLRKTGPELTSVPIYFHSCHLPLLYMWNAYHSMACQVVPVRTRDPNQQTLGCQNGMCALNHCAIRPAPELYLINRLLYIFDSQFRTV